MHSFCPHQMIASVFADEAARRFNEDSANQYRGNRRCAARDLLEIAVLPTLVPFFRSQREQNISQYGFNNWRSGMQLAVLWPQNGTDDTHRKEFSERIVMSVGTAKRWLSSRN